MRLAGWALTTGLLASAAGCNQLLGLDDGVVDTDGDGVADDVDNCDAVANPDQADADGDGQGDACGVRPCDQRWDLDLDADGVDDACDQCVTGPGPVGDDSDGDGLGAECDPCPTGGGVDLDGDHREDACQAAPSHDEDGDGVGDGADNCPTVANPDQFDSRPDGLGDACAPSFGRHDTSFFDGFGAYDAVAWAALPAAWRIEADDLVVVGVGRSSLSQQSPQRVGDLRVEGLVTMAPGAAGDGASIGLVDAEGRQLVTCTLAATGILTLDLDPLAGPTPKPAWVDTGVVAGAATRLHLVLTRPSMIQDTFVHCEVVGATGAISTPVLMIADGGGRLTLGATLTTATSQVRWAYVWEVIAR